MNLLLDTHAVLWLAENSPMLSQAAKEAIFNEGNQKFVSMASAWEVAIKNSIGKLRLANGVTEFYRMIEGNGFLLLPIDRRHVVRVESLPFHHRDPFDRLLVAAALCEELVMVTADENIPAYGVPCIW
ncbi:MAG: type II toxin-antitoxin system VapC family toxin [Oscillospiraceae bacterium]|jgi:PIN domain nuclease of toxin-antitoxin system|nr:type II toxin-antitoxin system VapC family toxin [Oscillospiraceae bacterium]